MPVVSEAIILLFLLCDLQCWFRCQRMHERAKLRRRLSQHPPCTFSSLSTSTGPRTSAQQESKALRWMERARRLGKTCRSRQDWMKSFNPIQGRLFWSSGGQGGGGAQSAPPPGKNPVPILRNYSSKIFLKACPKLSLVKQTWFPWQPWLWF